MSPLLIPTTIFSLALYVFFARLGFGSGIPALVIGHSIHVLPFAVRIPTASMQNFDLSLEEAARNVGAGPVRTMVSITLPVIRTGLVSSLVLCFVLSWNDFPISVFLAPAGWTPLPVELFSYQVSVRRSRRGTCQLADPDLHRRDGRDRPARACAACCVDDVIIVISRRC